MIPICKCRKLNRPGQRTCKACHREYMIEWRKAHPMTEAQRKRANARNYVAQYVRRGKIFKQDCVRCGGSDSRIHQPDPSKPLMIEWICKECLFKRFEDERLSKLAAERPRPAPLRPRKIDPTDPFAAEDEARAARLDAIETQRYFKELDNAK